MTLQKQLKKYGFIKKDGYYYKKIDDVFYLVIAIIKTFNYPKETDNGLVASYKFRYDLNIGVCLSEGPECSIRQMMKSADNTNVLEYFEKYIYKPLFENNNIHSLYDFMCLIDKWSFGEGFVKYNSYDKAFQAYREKRFEESMFCLKSIIYQNIAIDEPYILQWENRDLVNADSIENFRRVIKSSSKYTEFEAVFMLYDELVLLGI